MLYTFNVLTCKKDYTEGPRGKFLLDKNGVCDTCGDMREWRSRTQREKM